MSDERLRELERRWRESGDVSDKTAYLGHCYRAGLLTQEQVSRAAYFEDPAAVALAVEEGFRLQPARNLTMWAKNFAFLFRPRARLQYACLRANLALLRFALNEVTLEDSGDCVRLMELIEEWVCYPDCREDLGNEIPRAWDQCSRTYRTVRTEDREHSLLQIARVTALQIRTEGRWAGGQFPWDRELQKAVKSAARILGDSKQAPRELKEEARTRVRQIVRDELVPWILCTSDPLRRRVLARQQEAAGE